MRIYYPCKNSKFLSMLPTELSATFSLGVHNHRFVVSEPGNAKTAHTARTPERRTIRPLSEWRKIAVAHISSIPDDHVREFAFEAVIYVLNNAPAEAHQTPESFAASASVFLDNMIIDPQLTLLKAFNLPLAEPVKQEVPVKQEELINQEVPSALIVPSHDHIKKVAHRTISSAEHAKHVIGELIPKLYQ